MTPELRSSISLARQTHYFGILRTCFLAHIGIVLIIGFGPEGVTAPLAMLTISVTAFGILAGGTAMDDLANLILDVDDDTARTHFGRGIRSRNMGVLKSTSAALLGLVGLAELLAIFT